MLPTLASSCSVFFSLFPQIPANMMGFLANLPILAQSTSDPTFQFVRMQDEWMVLVGVGVLALILVFVLYTYIRDAVELHWSVATILVLLRVGAFGLLFWIWLVPQSQEFETIKQNSRVAVLVDVSTSMAHRDSNETPGLPGEQRLTLVQNLLSKSPLVEDLRQNHDLVVLRFFDDKLQAITELKRLTPEGEQPEQEGASDSAEGEAAEPKTPSSEGQPEEQWYQKLGLPEGGETRLGEALQRTIAEYRGGLLAGVVVLTDGQNNTGPAPQAVVELAQQAKVPIFPIGVGTTDQPINVRVDSLNVPYQAYLDDEYRIEGVVLGTGGPRIAGQTVRLELARTPVIEGTVAEAEEKVLEVKPVELVGNGEPQPVEFTLPAKELGRYRFELRIADPPKDDYNSSDNQRRAEVKIVKQETNVLLFAGGPNRDYQFVMSMLAREARRENSNVTVDVLLQIAQGELASMINQDATNTLSAFPTTAKQLSQYDCIIAFDPAWLGERGGPSGLTQDQMELVEDWVFRQGGGLIVTCGPVYTETWATKPEAELIRRLYPVEFERRLVLLEGGRFKNTKPRKILQTAEGLDANILWLEDDRLASVRAWNEFEGVYGYYKVRGPKTTAVVYARVDGPETDNPFEEPVYMADMIYGSGRVFYLGSPEIWRLRKQDGQYLDRFYNKLIRYISAGRGQAGNRRGALILQKDNYLWGQPVSVSAQLRGLDQKPLDRRAHPTVTLNLLNPAGNPENILLLPNDTEGAGTYVGQFVPRQQGDYRLELQIPDGGPKDQLTRTVQVSMPNLELANLARNDAVLTDLAEKTGASYTVLGQDDPKKIAEQLPAQTRTDKRLQKTEDLWDDAWVLYTIVGLLGAEWMIRRLARLA